MLINQIVQSKPIYYYSRSHKHFLDLSTSWRGVISFMPQPLYPRGKIGDWMGPRTGLDDMEKRNLFPLPGLELRPLSHTARSQSLYRLKYPGSRTNIGPNEKYRQCSCC
jgi:hypothetical protein